MENEDRAQEVLMNYAFKAIDKIFKEKDMKDYFAPTWWYEPDDECKQNYILDDDRENHLIESYVDGLFEEFGATASTKLNA